MYGNNRHLFWGSEKTYKYPMFFIISLLLLLLLLLRMRSVSGKSCRENESTNIMCNNLSSKIVPLIRKCGRILYSAGHRWQYDACALHAGSQSLQIHIRNTYCLTAFPLQQRFMNALQCYDVRTLPVLPSVMLNNYIFKPSWNTVSKLNSGKTSENWCPNKIT